MRSDPPDTIEIREFVQEPVERDRLSDEQGELLWNRYRRYIDVEPPTFRSGGRWHLTSLGWVGAIPLGDDLHILLKPKLPLGNLFRMLEYAYRLESFHLLDGMIECESIEDVYCRLAGVLARRVLDRCRRGLYRTYIAESDRLPYLRGELVVQEHLREPWRVDLHCSYQEHTADVEENRILAWTLHQIARQGICHGEPLRQVRAAYRALQGHATLRPAMPRECIGRLYNRLNNDYEPLHALCRFFLEHTGPGHERGDHRMVPFLVNMARLYELFVAEWLKRNLPEDLRLAAQERVTLDEAGDLSVNIDLVIYERAAGEPRFVLDTKYKIPDSPSPRDREQIVAYAAAKRCRSAVLIYPTRLTRPFNGPYGLSDFHVRTLAFELGGDIEEAGRNFLSDLLAPYV